MIAVAIKVKKETKEAAFTFPFKRLFESEEHGAQYFEKFPIIGFFPRKDPSAYGRDVAMKQKSGSTYDWECMVAFLSEGVNAIKVGKKLAREFTKVTSDKALSGMEHTERYTLRTVHSLNVKPLNHYLLDDACMLIFKKMYADTSVDDMLNQEEILVNFFCSADNGKKTLTKYDEDDWEDLLV